MEWSFHYAGPRQPSPDMDCVTCRAANTKKCPSHGTARTEGCAHCAAALGKPCQGHWGLEAALASIVVPEEGREEIDFLTALILGNPSTKDCRRITVTMRGSVDRGIRELDLRISPY